MAVRLRDTQIDGQVLSPGKLHRVMRRDATAPVGLGKPIYPHLPAETAAIECDDVCGQRVKIDIPRYDVGFDTERACPRLIEPKVDACQIARRDRAEGQCRSRRGFL